MARRCSPVPAALFALLLISAPAAAQSWPIKTFEVVNVEPAGLVNFEIPGLEEGDRNIHLIAQAIVRIIRGSGAFDPDFPDLFETVPLDAEAKADIESLLSQSAGVLEQWAFPRPALEPVVELEDGRPAYRVYLVSGLDAAAGEYHPNPCDSVWDDEMVILLNADHVLREGRLSPRGTQTVAHELFHAVQYGTPFFRECDAGSPGNWITEGQARAVGWDLARLLRRLGSSQLAGYRESLIGLRDYSERLPVPEYRSERAYRTASFWRYLSERLHAERTGSMLSPNLGGLDYSYLARFLRRRASARDCSETGAPCRAEIEWLDAGLRAEFGERLRDTYPKFIKEYVGYLAGRWPGLGGLPFVFQSLSFDHGCSRVFLRPHPDSLQVTSVTRRFDPVSAQCWEVDLAGFDNEAVEVAVTARGPRTAAQLEQLTAVVPEDAAGGTRIDTATVVQPLDLPSTTWYYTLPNADSSFVLLTNVAHTPASTRPLPDLNVTFTALRSVADVSAGSQGGPTPTEIDAPIRFDLDNVTGVVSGFDPDGSGEVRPGSNEVCVLSMNVLDPDIHFRMDMWRPGPIGPGTYRVWGDMERVRVPTDPDEFPSETFGCFFTLRGPQAPPGTETFRCVMGQVEIASVRDRLVRGTLHANGQAPSGGGMSIVADFAFVANGHTLRGPASVDRMAHDWAQSCLVEPPLETGDGPPPPPPGPDPDTPPPTHPSPDPEPDPESEPEPEVPEWSPPPDPQRPDPEVAPPDPPGAPDDPSDAPPSEPEPGAAEGGFVNALTVRVTGDADTTLTLRGDDFTWTGGCDGRSPLSLGFHRGLPNTPGWTRLGFSTSEVVGTGQAGAFDVEEVTWDHGALWSERMQGHVPNRFEGAGTLTLTTHDATSGSRQ